MTIMQTGFAPQSKYLLRTRVGKPRRPSRLPFWFLALPLTFAIMLSHASASPASDKSDSIAATVNAAADQFFKSDPQAVGLSIGVLSGGKVYTYNFGTTEKGMHRAPTQLTLYSIASVTKTFTGTLLAQAAIAKKLNLDDDVRKYLDGSYPNLEYDGHPIRLADLLDHRSGLPFVLPDRPELQPDYTGDPTPWSTRVSNATKNYSRQDFFADLHKIKLTSAPGTEFKYSNAAAQLVGYILERIDGEPYEVLLKRNILQPLGMKETTITVAPAQRPHLANGYDKDGKRMPPFPDQLQAAGGIKSSVSDLLKYVRWEIEEKDEAVKLSHQPQFTSGKYAAGLNWQMMSTSDERLIWQEGNMEGFNSLCLAIPELKLGLVVLANEEDQKAAHNLQIMTNQILKGIDTRTIPLP